MVHLAALLTARTRVLIQAQVGAARTQQLRSRRQGRLPVEDDATIQVADHDGIAGDRAGLHQLILDTRGVQTIRKVAHGLVVGKVGLTHPALRLVTAHLEDFLAVLAGLAHRDLHAAADGLRTDDGTGGLEGRTLGAFFLDDAGQSKGQLLEALVGHGGHLEDGPAERLQLRARDLGEIAAVRNIDLVEDDDAGALHDRHVALDLRQVTLVGLQLGLDDAQVFDRLAICFESGGVEHVHDDGATLDVAQEVEAEASSLGGAGDQAGNVGNRVARVAGRHDAQVRDQRRKGVIGDLRARRTQGGNQRGLSGGGEANESHVRDGLQLKDDVALLAGLTKKREAGGLACLRRQRRVAQTAAAALGDHVARARARQVGEQLTRHRLDDSALGNRQDDVRAGLTLAEVTHAGRAVIRTTMRATVVVQQRGLLLAHLKDHRTAIAAVSAVGAGQRLKLFTLNRGNAVTAIATHRMQSHAIHEVCHCCS